MPHTAITFAIATVAITGVLPISGFFSKDEILAQALNTSAFKFLTLTPDPTGPRLGFVGPLIYVLGTITAGITSFYMWRCYLLTFHGEYRGPEDVHPHESPAVMTIPLWVLATLSVVGLVLVLPIHDFSWSWESFTEGLFAHARGGAPAEHLPPLVTYGIAVVVAWAGFAIAWTLYKPARNIAGDVAFERAAPRLRRALVNKLYVDEVYNFLVVRPLWRTAKVLWRVVDAALIDGLFVNGSAQFVSAVGSLARRFQNGNVQRYAAVTALGVAALVYLLLVRT
jgi:NADH-quinone oxidoreductase subunit L